MKNTLCSILTALLIVLTFPPNSLTQDSQQEDVEDLVESLRKDLEDSRESLREDLPDKKIGKGDYSGYHINDIKFAPDGKHLAVAGSFGILLYDVQRRGKNVQKDSKPVKLAGHQDEGWRVAFSPDGKILATLNGTGSLRLWDTKTGQLIRTIEASGIVAFSPDGRTIIGGRDTHHTLLNAFYFYLFDVETGKRLRTFTGHTNPIQAVAFSPDSRTLATGSNWTVKDGRKTNGTVRLWDTRTGEHIRTLTGHTGSVYSVAFSPDDGTLLASSSQDKIVRLWDVKSGQLLRTFVENGPEYSMRSRDMGGGGLIASFGPIHCVAFSPDGRTLASAGFLGICLWDVNTGELRRKIRERPGGGHGIHLVAFSPNGKTIAACGNEGIALWDVETGQQIRTLISEDSY